MRRRSTVRSSGPIRVERRRRDSMQCFRRGARLADDDEVAGVLERVTDPGAHQLVIVEDEHTNAGVSPVEMLGRRRFSTHSVILADGPDRAALFRPDSKRFAISTTR